MSVGDVVSASLVAMERGEVVCIPGPEDASLVDRYHEAQPQLLLMGNRPDRAGRHRG